MTFLVDNNLKATKVAANSSPATLGLADAQYLAKSGQTITLPAITATMVGRSFLVKLGEAHSSDVTVSRGGTDTIEDNTSYKITSDYGFVELIASTGKWLVVKESKEVANDEALRINKRTATTDPSILINADRTGAGQEADAVAIAVQRGTTGADAKIQWNETLDRWEIASHGLYVQGNTSVGGTLAVASTGLSSLNGGIAVDTNKFTVDGVGNTAIAGTLAVTGETTLTGLLNANGGIAVDTNKFTVADGTGNTSVGGTLEVTGLSSLNGGIAVDTDKFTVDGVGNTLIAGTLEVTGNTTLTGNLTVNGTTTTINSTTTTVDDPIFTLGGDTAPASDDNKDRGIEFRWHNGSAAKVGFFGYDDSASVFTFIPDATNSSEVFSGTEGDAKFSTIYSNFIRMYGAATSVTVADPLSTDSTLTTSGVLNANGGISTTSGGLTIDSFTNAVTIDANGSVTGTLGVTGATTLSSTLAVTGNTTATGSIYANGGIGTTSGNLTLSGASGTFLDQTPTLTDNNLKVATTEFVQKAALGVSTKTANYTLALTDAGSLIEFNSASNLTLTIPANSSVAFPIGSQIVVARLGSGKVNIAITSDTLYSVSSNRYISNQYGAVTLVKRTSTTWYLFGDLSAS